MRISVNVTVEMTPEQAHDYADEYGLDIADKADVRRHVKDHINYDLLQVSYNAENYWKVTVK